MTFMKLNPGKMMGLPKPLKLTYFVLLLDCIALAMVDRLVTLLVRA